MSTAYFIVLDSDDPGFDSFVDGKILTKRIDSINQIAKALGLKQFEDYAYQDLSEFGGPDPDLKWFAAREGLDWASSLIRYLRDNPNGIRDVNDVIADLEDYVRVFSEANSRGLNWHLELDF